VAGRVTGVVVDPTDPDTIYISTAGGGAWKTKNSGLTWQPMIDSAVDAATGQPIDPQSLFTGTIAISPWDPRVIYIGTGEPNNSGDSYYGRGVLKSIDSGRTWTLIQPAGGAFNRRTITKIVVDPDNTVIGGISPSDRIYVAVNGG